MSITKFQRNVWSAKIKESLDTITSLRNHSDYTYKADSKNAKSVTILGVVRPTIKKYVVGTEIDREHATDASQVLNIDTFNYFNFDVDDVDAAQSTPGLMEALTKEAAKGLTQSGDEHVAEVIKAAVEADGSTVPKTSSIVTISKTNIVDTLEGGFAALYSNNCPVNDVYHLEVSPKFYTTLRPALTEVYTNNVDMMKSGYVGAYGNAKVSIENLLPTNTTKTATYNILRTEKAVAFVEQVRKIEAYRPEKSFSDAIKGLYGCGALVSRPEEMYIIQTAI